MWCLLAKFSLEALINADFLLNSSRRIYLFTSYTAGEGGYLLKIPNFLFLKS